MKKYFFAVIVVMLIGLLAGCRDRHSSRGVAATHVPPPGQTLQIVPVVKVSPDLGEEILREVILLDPSTRDCFSGEDFYFLIFNDEVNVTEDINLTVESGANLSLVPLPTGGGMGFCISTAGIDPGTYTLTASLGEGFGSFSISIFGWLETCWIPETGSMWVKAHPDLPIGLVNFWGDPEGPFYTHGMKTDLIFEGSACEFSLSPVFYGLEFSIFMEGEPYYSELIVCPDDEEGPTFPCWEEGPTPPPIP